MFPPFAWCQFLCRSRPCSTNATHQTQPFSRHWRSKVCGGRGWFDWGHETNTHWRLNSTIEHSHCRHCPLCRHRHHHRHHHRQLHHRQLHHRQLHHHRFCPPRPPSSISNNHWGLVLRRWGHIVQFLWPKHPTFHRRRLTMFDFWTEPTSIQTIQKIEWGRWVSLFLNCWNWHEWRQTTIETCFLCFHLSWWWWQW